VTARVVHIDRVMPGLSLIEQARWVDWFRRHGVEWEKIPIDSEIVCDDDARQIRYTALRLHENGGKMLAYYNKITETWDQDEVTVQLEAPALEFPVSPFLVCAE